MKNSIILLILSFVTVQSLAQLRLNVNGDGAISGELTVNSLISSGINISGNTPLSITTTATSVLNLKANNPLIELRDNSNNYLAFIQSFGSDLYLANMQNGRLLFRTNNLDRMAITASGNVGIGTTSSDSKLTINGPENDGTIAGLEIRSGSQKIIMDGNEIDCTSGSLHLNYNSQNDVLIRTAIRRAEFTMVHNSGNGASNGFAIENPGANNAYWTLYSTNSDGNLELYYKGSFRGEFGSVSGAYVQMSDRRLKNEITPLEGMLERVVRLRPSSYFFNDDATNKSNIGFVAQEVQSVFPELVSQGHVGDSDEEIYMMDYSGFGVIAIAAIQELLELEKTKNTELNTKNQDLQSQIYRLADRLDQLEHQLSNCCQNESSFTATQESPAYKAILADLPHLAQNAPNPFSYETSIHYYLPGTVQKAEIFLTDQNGRRIRSFSIDHTGHGKVVIEGGSLLDGIYFYSLVIDGLLWQSLPMIVTK